ETAYEIFTGLEFRRVLFRSLGVDYPSRVGSAGGRFRFNDDQETPDTHVVTFQFENETTIIWEGLSCSRYGNEGTVFHGEKGTLEIGRASCRRGVEIRRVTTA